ncbi:MAG: 4Fe-4S binding protein [Deferrisomatales bacterium]
MKPQARKFFDASTVPGDLCPISTRPIVLKTGEWRALRPVVRRDDCVKCATCWTYCPTQSMRERAAWFEADLEICKGCGVCAAECPQGAIRMVQEPEE